MYQAKCNGFAKPEGEEIMEPSVQQSKMYSPGAALAPQLPGSGQGTNASKATSRREVEIWFWLLVALIAGCLGSLLLVPHLLAI
jgi:hypothetical protein